jgi:membrane-anchored protein YejM (alkaline phosphatase superfamily)
MLSSRATRDAFDLSQEPVKLRERYGNCRVGQETILGRRLSEAGVPFTLINFSINQDWDTHTNGFKSLKETRLPEFDQAISALLDDLQDRGRLDSTLVAVITEFGRTPKINATAGRDHWSNVFSVVLAGGGLTSGQFLGTSNSHGEVPHDRPVHINDVLATIYQQLGIATDGVHYEDGRPVPVLYRGTPIPELV